jgi:type VI secretion system protein VasG
MSNSLKTLVNKLDASAREHLELASARSFGSNHQEVELEHWLEAMLSQPDWALASFCRDFEINTKDWSGDLNVYIDGLPDNCRRQPVLSRTLVQSLEKAWLLASLDGQQIHIQGLHLIGALLSEPQLRQTVQSSCHVLLQSASAERVLAWISRAPWESDRQAPLSPDQNFENRIVRNRDSQTPNLDRFTQNLTHQDRIDSMDPIIGRDDEIRQMIDILIRRRQNNPILTGEAGVGKTAVVEGLAQKIAIGDVPQSLLGSEIRSLDLGLLQAGAGVRGEFEKRLTGVIAEIQALSHSVILFIDEAHSLIGADGGDGQNDASNLLKPALARGELRTIAATTWREYKKYIETDPALTRRFQVVQVHEPGESNAIAMMRAVANTLRDHHKVPILDEAIVASVQLSARYIPSRQLPEKAVSLLDTACARVALSQSVTPGELSDLNEQLRKMKDHRSWLHTENLSTDRLGDTIADLDLGIQEQSEARDRLVQKWHTEAALAQEVSSLRQQLETGQTGDVALGPAELDQIRKKLFERQESLRALQAEKPLIHPVVDRQAVAGIVAQWTGIPVGQMIRDEIVTLLELQQQLDQRVIGQPQATETLARRIQSARADLTEPNKPVGVFLMIGPSGTGKTETALTLADRLFGGEGNLTVINMSEFKEEHKVSMLLGSPPGYVGYGEGGVLTEAVRRKPYSVVLLDEMEKAHPGLQDVFYNIFDKGTAKDGQGQDIDFRNTIIIMTSNACEDTISSCLEERPEITTEELVTACEPTLRTFFKAAFLGRTMIIPYYPLQDETLMSICSSRLERLANRVRKRFGARLNYDRALVETMAARSLNHDTGARFVENMITNEIVPQVAQECLGALAEGKALESLNVTIDDVGKPVFSVVFES